MKIRNGGVRFGFVRFAKVWHGRARQGLGMDKSGRFRKRPDFKILKELVWSGKVWLGEAGCGRARHGYSGDSQ